MDENWRRLFAPQILDRGRDYFNSGRIEKIEQDGCFIDALVSGEESYTVQIDFENDYPAEMSCTCPYAQHENYCKHMAAVLYALEEGDYAFPEEGTKTPPPEPVEYVPVELCWREAIREMPAEELRSLLADLVERNQQIQFSLTLRRLGSLPQGQLQNWKAELIENACTYLDRRGRLKGCDASLFLEDVEMFLQSILDDIAILEMPLEEFKTVWMVFETVMTLNFVDAEDDVQDFTEFCEVHWRAQFGKANETERAVINDWFWTHRDPQWGSFLKEIDKFFLIMLPWSDELYLQNMERYMKEQEAEN